MRVRRSRATSAGISPPALARWRTALASTTNLVIGYLRSGVGASQHYCCAHPRSTPAAPHGAQESSGTTRPGLGFRVHLVVVVGWGLVAFTYWGRRGEGEAGG